MNLIAKATGWLKNSRSHENKALFIFAALDNHVKGTGAGLYRTEPVFRESIAQLDLLLRAHGQECILPHFEGSENSGDRPDSAGTPFVGLAIQLALADLCRSKGVEPAAVLGIGLGEIPALCAAGAISREAAVRILAGSLAASRQPDVAIARAGLLEAMQGIVPGPVGCDYYSSRLARRLPAWSLAPHFLLEELPFATVHLDKTLQELTTSPWRTVVHCHAGASAAGIPGDAAFKALGKADNLYFFEEGQPGGKLPVTGFRRQQAKPEGAASEDSWQQFLTQFNIMAPPACSSPQATYAFLRQRGDIHFLPRSNSWLVLSYELVKQVLQDHQTFSNSPYKEMDPLLTGADQPDHKLVRSLVQPHFSPRAIKAAVDQAELEVRRCLKQLSRKPGFDVVSDFSTPVAQAAMGRLLGMDEVALRSLQSMLPLRIYENDPMDISKDFFSAYMNSPDNALGADGMKRVLLEAVKDGTISMEGAVDLMKVFWIAGIMTITLHLSNLVYELLLRPGVAGELRQDVSLISNFINECLRLNPPAIQIMRLCNRDTVLGGRAIPAGSLVVVGMLAANRDPAVFERADELLLNRSDRPDFAFGGGIHYCLGHHLAKQEAQVVVTSILPLLDKLQLDPEVPVQMHYRMDLYGVIRLPVRWR